MKSNCELSVIIPAYLEEENLRVLLPRLGRCLSEMGIGHEILVIDTEAPLDETEAVCIRLGARCIRRAGGNSFGDAVRTGIKESVGTRVLCMDADGSHPPEFISRLWARREEADIVIASRYVRGGYTENSLLLVAMSRILNTSYSLILGLPCRDVSNSFKLYPGAALRQLQLRCDHFDVVEEILVKLIRRDRALRILEVPFTFKKRMFGDTKRSLLLFVASYLFTMAKLRFMSFMKDSVPTSEPPKTSSGG